jgi:ketosteroid isomerase-like protein
MIARFTIVLLIAVAVFTAGCETAQKPATDATKEDGADKVTAVEITEAEVKDALELLQATVEKNDREGLDKIYADDYMIVNPDGKAETKAERMEAMKTAKIEYEKVEFADPKIRIYGNTAVVITNAKGKAKQDGKETEMDMTATIVFVKTKDGVKEVTAHLGDRSKE